MMQSKPGAIMFTSCLHCVSFEFLVVLLMKIQVLESYAVSSGKLLQTFSVFMLTMDCLTMKVEVSCFSETLASIYQSMRPNIAEVRVFMSTLVLHKLHQM